MEDNLDPKAGWENFLAFENSREVAEQFVTATRKLSQGAFTEADARALLDELLKAGRHNPLFGGIYSAVFHTRGWRARSWQRRSGRQTGIAK